MQQDQVSIHFGFLISTNDIMFAYGTPDDFVSFQTESEESPMCTLNESFFCAEAVTGKNSIGFCSLFRFEFLSVWIINFHQSSAAWFTSFYLIFPNCDTCYFSDNLNDERCGCSLPCKQILYKPTLSNAQLSRVNVENYVISDPVEKEMLQVCLFVWHKKTHGIVEKGQFFSNPLVVNFTETRYLPKIKHFLVENEDTRILQVKNYNAWQKENWV